MLENMNMDLGNMLNTYVIPWAINIFLALVIFVVGRWIPGVLVKILRKGLLKANMDPIRSAIIVHRWHQSHSNLVDMSLIQLPDGSL